MKVEIIIPIIICIMIGVLFFVGYLVHIQRITKKLGYSMMAIFFVFSCVMCGAIYHKNVALRENSELEIQLIKEAENNVRPSLPYLSAVDIAKNAKIASKDDMLTILRNRQVNMHHLYLAGVLGKDKNTVYAFADSASPTISKDKNIFFFGKGISETVDAKLKLIPKGRNVLATVEFVDLQNVGDDLGFPVTAFIILIYDVVY